MRSRGPFDSLPVSSGPHSRPGPLDDHPNPVRGEVALSFGGCVGVSQNPAVGCPPPSRHGEPRAATRRPSFATPRFRLGRRAGASPDARPTVSPSVQDRGSSARPLAAWNAPRPPPSPEKRVLVEDQDGGKADPHPFVADAEAIEPCPEPDDAHHHERQHTPSPPNHSGFPLSRGSWPRPPSLEPIGRQE
jgi:hypothetical protein